MQAALPRWSPDGSQIAFFTVTPSETPKLYLVAASGGAPRRATSGTEPEADPSWSPDGQQLVFGGRAGGIGDPSSRSNIQVLDLRTGKNSPLPGSNGLFSPRWSPNGRYIVALTQDSLHMRLFDLTCRVLVGSHSDAELRGVAKLVAGQPLHHIRAKPRDPAHYDRRSARRDPCQPEGSNSRHWPGRSLAWCGSGRVAGGASGCRNARHLRARLGGAVVVLPMGSARSASVPASEEWLAIRSSLSVSSASEGWYRYGDSNPGPVAENHVS